MQRKIYDEGVLDSDVFSKYSVLNIEFRSRIKKTRFLLKSSKKNYMQCSITYTSRHQ